MMKAMNPITKTRLGVLLRSAGCVGRQRSLKGVGILTVGAKIIFAFRSALDGRHLSFCGLI